MSLLIKCDDENENSQRGCFPNNKTIKSFMKRSSRVALRPRNGQRSKKANVEEKDKKKEVVEITPKTENSELELITPASNFERIKKFLEAHGVPDFEPYRESVPEICDLSIYRQEMWKALIQNEKRYKWPKPNYMKKQPQIDMSMRRTLIDWLVQVKEHYKMDSKCIHLAVSYIDLFLSKMSVMTDKFQLLGVTAMFVAGKLEEIYPPFSHELADLTAESYTPQQIRRMEKLLLTTIEFDVQPPTIPNFIEHLCHELNMDRKILYLAMYLSELMLLENTSYLKHLPSKIAASSVALARLTLSNEEAWPKHLKNFSNYSIKQLSPVVKKQQKIFIESPTKPQQAIQEKYRSPRYRCVGLIKPVALNLDDTDED